MDFADLSDEEGLIMTKLEAYKNFRCVHCVFWNEEAGCFCGDPESDDCPKDKEEREENNDDELR